MRVAATLAFGLVACSAASGCATAAVAGAAGLTLAVAQERTVGVAIDDAAAAAEVKARLIARDRTGFAEVDVEIADRRLLLSGVVPTAEHRIEAERIAWTVTQIEAVANEINVGPRSGLWRSAMDELVTAQVRARLVASSEVRALDVNIETHQGVVYLLGLARTQAEVERAAEIASITPGVDRVVSYMHVRAAPVQLASQAAMGQTPPAYDAAPQDWEYQPGPAPAEPDSDDPIY
jgi:osmotically-inducible protein OsmY